MKRFFSQKFNVLAVQINREIIGISEVSQTSSEKTEIHDEAIPQLDVLRREHTIEKYVKHVRRFALYKIYTRLYFPDFPGTFFNAQDVRNQYSPRKPHSARLWDRWRATRFLLDNETSRVAI